MFVLTCVFFAVAWIYASVGFGGGSAYVALLVLYGLPYAEIPQLSLLCNIIVAGSSFLHYRQRGYFSWSLFWPFALTSIPFTYLASSLTVPKNLFLLVLGLSLLLASLRILWQEEIHVPRREDQRFLQLGIGAVIGFLSGLVGIGGGVFLAPILLNCGWGRAKQVAAVSSAFILVNSLSGLHGQWVKMQSLSLESYWPLFLAVFVGGQFGSWWGAGRLFSQERVRKISAYISLFVGMHILQKFL